jgi:hypothetical protein
MRIESDDAGRMSLMSLFAALGPSVDIVIYGSRRDEDDTQPDLIVHLTLDEIEREILAGRH